MEAPDSVQATALGRGSSIEARFEPVISLIEKAMGAVNFVVLVLMSLSVLAGVVSRYVFNDSFSWTEEFSVWAFTWMIFIGAAMGIRQKRHVAVDFVLGYRVTRFLRDVIVALTLIMLAFAGYRLATLVGGLSITLQWPNAYRFGVIPTTAAIGLLFALFQDGDGRTFLRNAAAIVTAAIAYLVMDNSSFLPFIDISPSLLMTVTFFVCLFLGVPVAFSLLFGAFLTTWGADIIPGPAVVQTMASGATNFLLLAIPFFLTTGYLLDLGGLSSRLIDLAAALVGHLRGGLAHVNILNSLLIGGISGSSGADAASTTKIIVPQMVKRGYSPAFSCAVTAAGSILPNVVPPAIAMLVYASVADVSIAKLFIAGYVPGVLIAIAMMTTAYLVARKRGYETASARAPLSTVGTTFLRALPALFIAAIIIGCIRFGITTATEAGAIALFWTFILGKFAYREYTWKAFYRSLVECATDSALIGFLIAASIPFAWVLIAEQIPQQLIEWIGVGGESKLLLLLMMNAILFVAGMFLDLTPAMLILAPLFLPLMKSVGMDPVQLGMIMIINLQMGGLTPPVGILVFISAQIAKVSPVKVFREVMPFFLAGVIVLALVCAFPVLTLGLWNLME
ncbi:MULTISPECIES: TRAP transporter large permease subunit [unclassified Mesorhizobium]|uniref:TRAP transporter large permease n=1 Tax=unclassified Mesorhizobium TaxID=325217 RepID=UPI001125D65B|nr:MULTISPECIES: TRAP transporter large permease subunit [unclassified Mesorhizobium]MBZ9894458.1 TRAP transporter large permease subunit [Mesorhizobium sp. BR1-1-6]TPM57593.1 TRAP transporter large permease subunit [Mesorhizobium sp. B2-2-4]TPM65604.1 TRAP transporter large permease subunit [Mesorhizobium sp. B2-2-1]TPN38486.1 TRAP transporter large permease subunit [Mesorhizobium sp. B1-1-6]TPN71930.1 TRAP transporter large permease subunit [Mesorhizobium sp. B1-1-3]